MLRMVLLLDLPLDMPATSSTNFAAFRCHNCQTSSWMAFALFFCAAPFLGTGLPLKSPCCTRHIAVWLRVGSSRLKPHSSNCAACGLPKMHVHPGVACEPLRGALSTVWRLSDGAERRFAQQCGSASTKTFSETGHIVVFFLGRWKIQQDCGTPL